MSQINIPDLTQDQSFSSISPAAHAYQFAMQEQQASTPPPALQTLEPAKEQADVLMADLPTSTDRAPVSSSILCQ
jgi:hypothetical protein